MYMNCAVVDIVPKGSHSKRGGHSETLEARDVQMVNVAAQAALSSYPSLFVANLAKINDCVTKETQDVMFDAPGKDVAFADGKSGSAAPSFGKGKCTGQGSASAGSSSSSSSSPPPPSGNNGQWNGGSQSQPSSSQSSSSSCPNAGDGQWHPECYGQPAGQKAISASLVPTKPATQKDSASQAQTEQTVQDVTTGKQPTPKVEEELDAYLSGLYGDSKTAPQSKRNNCKEVKREPCAAPNRWVKRDACTWACQRKGRRAQLTPSTTTTPTIAEAKNLESELRNLETTIAHLIDLTSQKQQEQLGVIRREAANSTNTANSTVEPTPSNTFDLFLGYLSRVQSTVVECIRNIAAATPSGSPVPAVELVAANPVLQALDMAMAKKRKRQLFVPNLADIISAMNIDSNDPLYSALNDLDRALQTVGELVGKKVGAGDVDSGLGALLGAVNAAPTIANATTLPFILNSTTLYSNSTDELQNAADLAAALANDVSANTPPTSVSAIYAHTPTPLLDPSAAILPYLLGPGPVIPPPSAVSDLAVALSKNESASTTSISRTSTPTPLRDPSAAILPYLLGGPGLVVPPGSIFSLPGPDAALPSQGVSNLETFPTVVDDLGPGAEKDVRKFFEGLKDDAGGDGDDETDNK
jgi:hypothetical protein